jgi:hypothetical protein
MGVFIPDQCQTVIGSAVIYILLGSEIWPENARDGNAIMILARSEASYSIPPSPSKSHNSNCSKVIDACHRHAQLIKRCTVQPLITPTVMMDAASERHYRHALRF